MKIKLDLIFKKWCVIAAAAIIYVLMYTKFINYMNFFAAWMKLPPAAKFSLHSYETKRIAWQFLPLLDCSSP